jgi:peptidoglycan/xylan/chitin deacetylase (PgdA/CDA1 family)
MSQLEDALVSILGYFPQYMRPPYFSYNDQTLSTLGGLGYHVIQCDIDTLDWQNNSPSTIQNSETIYQNGLNSGGTISLTHDPLPDTVHTLVQEMINDIRAKGANRK